MKFLALILAALVPALSFAVLSDPAIVGDGRVVISNGNVYVNGVALGSSVVVTNYLVLHENRLREVTGGGGAAYSPVGIYTNVGKVNGKYVWESNIDGNTVQMRSAINNHYQIVNSAYPSVLWECVDAGGLGLRQYTAILGGGSDVTVASKDPFIFFGNDSAIPGIAAMFVDDYPTYYNSQTNISFYYDTTFTKKIIGNGSGITNIRPAMAVSTYTGTNLVTNARRGDIFRATLTKHSQVGEPTLPDDGQTLTWWLRQDNVGGWAVTLHTNFVVPSSATLPIAWSTAPGAMDILAARYDAQSNRWYVISVVPGY